MGLLDMMRTSVSGMGAQANRLGAVGDNIANSSTIGYKRASTEFSSLVLQAGKTDYVSGSVETRVLYNIGEQGALSFTTSATDLAVKGNGFFVVSGPGGQTYLTRAGSFVKDGNGDLVNSAGFKLMGYNIASGAANVVSNGSAGLVPVNIGAFALQANASTQGQLFVNLPSNSSVVAAADLPAANGATATYAGKTSLVTYDSLGNQVTLDVYSANKGGGDWEISIYDHAAAASSGGFPYSSGPLASTTLSFDSSGKLAASSPTSLSLTIPNGSTFNLDLSKSSQLATGYTVLSTTVDGNAPSGVESVAIKSDGTLDAIFGNGQRTAMYRIPLGNVPSPDNLQPLAGNVYSVSTESGAMQVGLADSAGLGSIASDALEQSTVDLASELTTMIAAQRDYQANSKVFQTGSDLTQVLIDLKR
jgi:flagellar hook protein FlgE